MSTRFLHIVGIISSLAIIGVCFIPWTFYNSIHETFTGYHVIRFTTGNYYGRAGIVITVFSSLILLLMFINKIWAKRINLFLSALLFAYTIRTYIIFTSALFEGEVEKKPGIYLIVFISAVMLISAAFPKVTMKNRD